MDGRNTQIAEDREMREEVEALKHHADFGALGRRCAIGIDQLGGRANERDSPTASPSTRRLPSSMRLEVVDAAQERRLAAAARPEQADDFAGLDVERNACEHLQPVQSACAHCAYGPGASGLSLREVEPKEPPNTLVRSLAIAVTLNA